jgi:peptidoglycan/xylan/chitin deacetylase (PgdA/CDA1 family)
MSIAALLPRAAVALNIIGADSILGSRHRGVGSVLVFHSVVPDRRPHLLDRLRTSAAFLEALIVHYLSRGIDIISLDEALARLDTQTPKPFVCFTFDDGYRDNVQVALPLFARYGLPFTVFITTCFVHRTMNVWWSGLALLLQQSDFVEVPALQRTFQTATFQDKVRAYRSLCATVGTSIWSEANVTELLESYGISSEAILDKEALSEVELVDLAANPLVTIGAHTHSHPNLAKLPLDVARREITENKEWLEDVLDREVQHFAYPYGDRASCGEREFALAREIGFRSAVTTRIGNLSRTHLGCLTNLPRLRPFNEHESIRLLEFQRSGAANALAGIVAH